MIAYELARRFDEGEQAFLCQRPQDGIWLIDAWLRRGQDVSLTPIGKSPWNHREYFPF